MAQSCCCCEHIVRMTEYHPRIGKLCRECQILAEEVDLARMALDSEDRSRREAVCETERNLRVLRIVIAERAKRQI
jgi:hypothetical protein